MDDDAPDADLDQLNEAIAMQHEADRLAAERHHEERMAAIRASEKLTSATAAAWDERAGRQHSELMARLDRIAAALERLAP